MYAKGHSSKFTSNYTLNGTSGTFQVTNHAGDKRSAFILKVEFWDVVFVTFVQNTRDERNSSMEN